MIVNCEALSLSLLGLKIERCLSLPLTRVTCKLTASIFTPSILIIIIFLLALATYTINH
jgi:hypothetical protein